MDYYASWPRRSIPKWVGVTLGGVFSFIVVVCAGMIVYLLRPAKHAPPAAVVAAVPQPQPAPAVTTPAATVAQPAPVAASAPAATPTPPATSAPVAQPAPAVAQAAAKKHPHKRAVLAKHEGKAGHTSKSDIDRLLGL
jgi:type IV secretory pathway VirB10-like protein